MRKEGLGSCLRVLQRNRIHRTATPVTLDRSVDMDIKAKRMREKEMVIETEIYDQKLCLVGVRSEKIPNSPSESAS